MIDDIGEATFAVRASIKEFLRDGGVWILVTVSLARFLSIGVRQVIPAIIPGLKVEFTLSNAVAGLVVTSLWVAYALSQLPGGIITDVVGERKTLTTSLLLSAVGLAFAVVAPGFVPFVVGLVVFGFGIGLLGTARITVLSDIFGERGSTAIGINNAVGGIGAAGLPVAAGVLAGYLGWRFGLGFVLPVFVVTAVAVQFSVPLRTSAAMNSDGTRSTADLARYVVSLVRTRTVAVAWVAMAMMGFIYQGFTGLLPTYLESVKAFDQGTAVAIYGLFFAGAVVIQPFAGAAADTYGKRPTLLGITAVSAATLFTLPFTNALAVVSVVALVASVQMAFWPVILEHVTTTLPDDVQGSGMGLIRTTFLLLAATGPSVVGTLADLDRFDEAYLLLGTMALVVFALCVAFLETGE